LSGSIALVRNLESEVRGLCLHAVKRVTPPILLLAVVLFAALLPSFARPAGTARTGGAAADHRGIPAGQGVSSKGASLTEEEEDKLRETQDPGQRIELYIAFAQIRLGQFDDLRYKPPDPQYDIGASLDKLLGSYIAVDDELKNWIEYQYQRDGDMRKGLRVLLDQGPQQLGKLKQIQESSDHYSADYRDSLRDAIEDLTDTLDGATKALADQEKRFGQLRREEKATEHELKQTAKEEKKRMKEEQKLRKKEHKHGVPEDPDQD